MPLNANPSGGFLAKLLGTVMQQGPTTSALPGGMRKVEKEPPPAAPPSIFDQSKQPVLGNVRPGVPPPMQGQASGGVLPGRMLQQLLLKLMQAPQTLPPPDTSSDDALAAMQMMRGR